MDKLKQILTAKEIDERVSDIANQISHDFENSTPILLGVLKGSYIFLADLTRKMKIESEVEFVRLKSYNGNTSTNNVKILYDFNKSLEERDIIIIEDIIDTGNTLNFLCKKIQELNPRSISIASFLVKPESNKFRFKIDYIGFEIPSDFVVGYGLDFDEKYRNLDSLFCLINK